MAQHGLPAVLRIIPTFGPGENQGGRQRGPFARCKVLACGEEGGGGGFQSRESLVQ